MRAWDAHMDVVDVARACSQPLARFSALLFTGRGDLMPGLLTWGLHATCNGIQKLLQGLQQWRVMGP